MSISLTATRGQRIHLGTPDFPAATGACSITLWARASAFTIDGQRLICKATASVFYWAIDIFLVSGVQRFSARLRTGTTTYTATTTSHVAATNTTYFLVMKYDGSTLKLFCNNVEIASTSCTGNIATNSAVVAYIGDSPEDTVRTFNGNIEDVRVYSKALSANEMTTIYFGGGRDNTLDSLLCRWKLNYGAVNTPTKGVYSIIDSGPNKLHVQAQSGGTCLNFTRASNHQASVANIDSTLQLVAPFTIMAWIKTADFPDWTYPVAYTVGKIVSYGSACYECISAHTSNVSWTPDVTPTLWKSTAICIFSTRNESNGIWFGMDNAGIALKLYASTVHKSGNVITRNTWYNVAVIFSDVLGTKYITFFLNGSQVAQVTAIGGANPGTTLSTAQIGASLGNDYFDGKISEIMVFKGLDAGASNIARWMYEDPIPTNANLVAHWDFNEETDDYFLDASGNQHTAFVSNTGMIVEDHPITAPKYSEPLATV